MTGRTRLLAGAALAASVGVASMVALDSPTVTTGAATDHATAPLHAVQYDEYNAPYDALYHFVRIRYGSRRGGGFGFRGRREPPWAHDWPRAERNFLAIIEETTDVRVNPSRGSNVVTLDDPEFFKFPISYIVEPGDWNPTDEELENLGTYLLKGGFLIVDDFRGRYALDNLELQLAKALPGFQMFEIDETSDIFDSFFRIIPEQVIPPYGGGFPRWYALYEDNDPEKRLMVIINADNDIAEYWEYSDRGYYPIDLANEAYKLGVNYVVYGLTH